jgi:hypothetical protein
VERKETSSVAAATPVAAELEQRYVLEDTDFCEVPPLHRRFYRAWKGEDDVLGPNEVRCPVCGVVLRSYRALREGDRLHCLPCLTRLVVAVTDGIRRAQPVH